jgi:hypothetical protein
MRRRSLSSKLDVACREIELIPTDDRLLPRIVGPGRIYQTSDGQLRFTSYPASDLPDIGLPPLSAGAIIPTERTWSLRGIDQQGRRWEAEKLWLDLEEPSPEWRPLTRELGFIQVVEDLPKRAPCAHFRGYIFRHLQIAANGRTTESVKRSNDEWSEKGVANLLRFPLGELECCIRQEPEHTVIDVTTEGALPRMLKQRLLETTRFVFGRPVSWSATVRTEGLKRTTYLRGSPLTDRKPYFPAPVAHNWTTSVESMSGLFRAYFEHVMKETTPAWHPLSQWWSETLGAGTREGESLILTASVAVEGITSAMVKAGDLPPGIERITKEEANTWQELTIESMNQLGCPEKILKRVRGLFSQMARIGPHEVLTALAKRLTGSGSGSGGQAGG